MFGDQRHYRVPSIYLACSVKILMTKSRGFRNRRLAVAAAMSLFCWSADASANDGSADEVLIDEAIPVPYVYETDCGILLTRTIPATTASRFRVEFSQFLAGGFSGPRVLELDGFAFGVCGDVVNDDGVVTATDALSILARAVGGGHCEPCLCDATNDGVVTATDALAALRGAVGQTGNLNCPACGP